MHLLEFYLWAFLQIEMPYFPTLSYILQLVKSLPFYIQSKPALHLIITDSLLCPWGKKVLTFSLNSTNGHFLWPPQCSELTGFDYTWSLKRYPFRTEPPRIGHYRDYPHPPGFLNLPNRFFYDFVIFLSALAFLSSIFDFWLTKKLILRRSD